MSSRLTMEGQRPPEPNRIEEYCIEIEKALDNGLLYPALALSLSLPDICVSLHLPPYRSTWRTHYIRWCRRYVTVVKTRRRRGTEFRATHVYALRCAFLHNGTTELQKRQDRTRGVLGTIQLVWTRPKPNGYMILGFYTKQSRRERQVHVQMDVEMLCNTLMRGARTWMTETAGNRNVQRNLPRLVGIRRRIEEAPESMVGRLSRPA